MSSTTLAIQVLERLLSHDSLKQHLQFVHIQRFLELTSRIWPEIVPPGQPQPLSLPPKVAGFLASVLNLDTSVIQLTWHAFSDLAEENHIDPSHTSLDDTFRIHARPYQIECHTRYYHNYYVQNAKELDAERQYYSFEIPRLIHVFESSYVDLELCKYFGVQLALSHGTCQGISRVYNMALGASDLPNGFRLASELSGDLVLDAFLLHAILQDKKSRRETLLLPHHGYQNHRFDRVLAQRNYRMAGTGQDMWAHACNQCMKIYQGEDGNWCKSFTLSFLPVFLTLRQIESLLVFMMESRFGTYAALYMTVWKPSAPSATTSVFPIAI
ncbi:hypothetical protein DFH09DRAFT_1336765 [Mycena vulgaris]|nr:hypothetical protein DFH09DRAFT_1336765 [Mycena vulgaris]